MIHRLSKQLGKETARYSHSYVVLSILAMVVFASWFVYQGVTDQAQAQTVTVPTSNANTYISPRINLGLAPGEYLSRIIDFTPTGVLAETNVDYKFSLYTGMSTIPWRENLTADSLFNLPNSTNLQNTTAFSFTAELSVSSSGFAPIVDSVKLDYETTTTPLELQGSISPSEVSVVPGFPAIYTINIFSATGSSIDIVDIKIIDSNWPADAVLGHEFTDESTETTGIFQLTINTDSSFDPSTDKTYNFMVQAEDADGNIVALPVSTLIITSVPKHIPNLSINFTAKVDHGSGAADPDLPFYFYLFKENALTPVFTSAPAVTYLPTTDQYQYQGDDSIIIESSKLEAATYKAYLKTPKHLSKKADTDIVVTLKDGAEVTTTLINLNFSMLKVGDIGGESLPYGELGDGDKDDSVTVSDWSIFTGLFGTMGETVTTLLGDFNNDKSVNVHDLWPFKSQSDGGNYQLDGDM